MNSGFGRQERGGHDEEPCRKFQFVGLLVILVAGLQRPLSADGGISLKGSGGSLHTTTFQSLGNSD